MVGAPSYKLGGNGVATPSPTGSIPVTRTHL